MSLFYEAKKAAHGTQRRASGGATITLVSGVGEYSASFECAKRIASILGERELKEHGDGIFESIPVYKIPFADMPSACERLSKHFSIALVDLFCERDASQFTLIWRIERTAAGISAEQQALADKAFEEIFVDEPKQAKGKKPISLDEF